MLESNKKLIYILPFVLFIAMTVLLYTGLGKDPTKLDSQLIGQPIPAFEKTLLLSPDKTISEKDVQGPALVNVFASWCPACYHEHPYLMQLTQSKTVKIYGLNYKDKREAGLKFINDLGNPYDLILFDDNGRLGVDLGVYGAPETFVINSDNKIVYRHVGIVNLDVWQTILKPKMFPEANEQQEQGAK
ncbi:DsbE family thiol:disulfide interchange protein [Aliikangiella coralliicola]|uniref:DsbE family thiol:disulfide interchange protein n=1 Tax=Aliikangiella coralliicola TaxID=2592383 RepID=A0A545UAD1_9GAMM|nr:DsbE family thiol:disulfide interchange protein [Aliikangiella coralliicola]TQV86426.1 DsbE family thiol:disulfide interchange protein [Aliikangiella coralliicola]